MATTKRQKADAAPAHIGEWLHESALKLWAGNPRDNEAAVPKVAESIRRYGFISPVVLWPSKNMLVAGHTRLKALRALLREDPAFVPPGAPGPGVVPVRVHEFASEAEAQAYAIADNRLSYEADWDYTKLAPLLESIGTFDPDLVDLTGFRRDELDAITKSALAGAAGTFDLPDADTEPKTRPDASETAKNRRIELPPAAWAMLLNTLRTKLGVDVETEEEVAEAFIVLLRRLDAAV